MLALDAAFREGGPTAELVFRLERDVMAWLRDHIYVADAELGRFVTATLGADASFAW